MGFFADLKAKRADKKALRAFEAERAIWQEDVDTLNKLITVYTAASKGEDSIPNTLKQKAGEIALWSATGVFHEMGRTATRYVGRSSGVSIPVVAGIRFHVGAMQGTAVPGQAYQMDKDEGVVILTTERLVFAGPLQTQQWEFDKLLMISTTPDESDYFLSVSNRKTTSGVRFPVSVGREFNRFLGSAAAVNESGYASVLGELKKMLESAKAAEPKLVLPSTTKAIEA